ncbi:GluClalpha [Strongyloides ratti]|uniref:GluClalpha n=1 Tax=Strongyloides ratti TaxID=34506 RepID=A0A090LHL9_STRRB|nr:GluClalpha [Strongyloides ratti]CEF67648.1 GluClalpha [Strongyloides ratti]
MKKKISLHINLLNSTIYCYLKFKPMKLHYYIYNLSKKYEFMIFFIFIMESHCIVKRMKEQTVIQRILQDYDWRVRPRGNNESWPDTGGPVEVKVNIYLRSISKIDDVNMEYSAQFTFRETWTDPRLAYQKFADENTDVPPFVVLATSENGDQSQQIWKPDSFFQNEKEARRHMIDKPNVLIRIHPDGSILYSVRLSLVLSCPMSLEYYPLDRQTCLIDLASYAYTTDDIKYDWKEVDPIQQKAGLKQSLPSFELQDVRTGYCTSKTNTGEYSCLQTQLLLRREFSYYLLQLYIPSFMLVIVSWVSFWLDKDSIPARITLGVTTLLTMTTQSSGINAKLPPVSYTKAIDVWIGVCLAFIFGALLEFALVNYAARRDMSLYRRMLTAKQSSAHHIEHYRGYQPLTTVQPRSSCCFKLFVSRYKERSKRIDVVSRVVFPIGEYSCLRTELKLRREYSYYLIQLYIPCVMLVVVSWVSFWLDKGAIPARTSLGVTTLLTMTTQASGINSKLPPVSYIKAVDIWIGVCLGFIFGALLEYALVNYHGRQEAIRKDKAKKNPISLNNKDNCICPPKNKQQSSILPFANAGIDIMNFNNHTILDTYKIPNNDNLRQGTNETKRFPSLRLDLAGMSKIKRNKTILHKLKITKWIFTKTEVSKRIDLVSRATFPFFYICFLVFYYLTYFTDYMESKKRQ